MQKYIFVKILLLKVKAPYYSLKSESNIHKATKRKLKNVTWQFKVSALCCYSTGPRFASRIEQGSLNILSHRINELSNKRSWEFNAGSSTSEWSHGPDIWYTLHFRARSQENAAGNRKPLSFVKCSAMEFSSYELEKYYFKISSSENENSELFLIIYF